MRRVSIAASAGIWLGALAGLATSLADFGAHWLFMESAEDRAALLGRLLCLLPMLGAAVGALAGSWFASTSPLCTAIVRRLGLPADSLRARLVVGAVWSAPLLWPLGEVARLLWSGGTMSRLPLRSLGIAGTFAGLAAGAAVGLAFVQPFTAWMQRVSRTRQRSVLLLLMAAAIGAWKLNQHILHKKYE